MTFSFSFPFSSMAITADTGTASHFGYSYPSSVMATKRSHISQPSGLHAGSIFTKFNGNRSKSTSKHSFGFIRVLPVQTQPNWTTPHRAHFQKKDAIAMILLCPELQGTFCPISKQQMLEFPCGQLRIWRCYCSGSGHCFGVGSIPGLGASTCHRHR